MRPARFTKLLMVRMKGFASAGAVLSAVPGASLFSEMGVGDADVMREEMR
jgi:hypothetical protein